MQAKDRPYFQLLTDKSVECFFKRYLALRTSAQVLVIISPYIGDLVEGHYKLRDLLNKAVKDKTRIYVITRPPSEEYHRVALNVLESYPNVEIRLNSEIHAKLFVCWCREEEESFALFGSGNLTSGGLRFNLELGMMILSRGHGRTLVQNLYCWGCHDIRTQSECIKPIYSSFRRSA
jgi:HKD family nuclease